MKVRFTPSARREFFEAIAYIRRDKPGAASEFQKKANQKLQRLRRFPVTGRRIPEFLDLSYREVVVPPFRFFYRTQDKTVWIVAVWHGAQIPDEPTT